MFTGIVAEVGRVRSVTPSRGGLELALEAGFADLAPGESVAVDGACLTVTSTGEGCFAVHVVNTTLPRTRFGGYAPGTPVNLERALRLADRLGGHLVQGHVDGLGRVLEVAGKADAVVVDIGVPDVVAEVTVPLGSIAVDGVSLTVVAIPEPARIRVALVPFTLQHTTLGRLVPGAETHLEADLIGKYVKELLRGRR